MAMRRIFVLIAFCFVTTAAFAQTNRDGDQTEGQVSFGLDTQNFSNGRTATVGSVDATIRLSKPLTLEAVATGGTYFGEPFGGGGAYLTVKPDAKTYLTVGGSRNSDTSTTVAWSGSLELGRTAYQSPRGWIRGVEANFNLTKRGYHFPSPTGALLLNPSVVVYLPRDWGLTLRAGATRINVAGATRWTPSGGARLDVPLTRRLSVSPGVAFDSELSDVLQLTNISSREFGAAAHFWLTRRTSVGAYYFRVLYGANHLTSDSYGVSYALRF